MNKSTHRTLKKKMNTDIKYSTIKGQTSTKQAHQHKISHELTNPSEKKPGGKNKTSWIFWVLEGQQVLSGLDQVLRTCNMANLGYMQ